MKNIVLFTLALLSFSKVFAQQEPLFSQYNSNAFLINPAVAGSKDNHSINLFHRWQWVTFPGAPITFGLTYQGKIGKVHGLGALLFADITGPSMRIGFKGSYAFHIPFKNNLTLSVGVAARIVRNSININTITFRNNNDIAIANATEAVYGGDAELGLFLYHPKFWVGFSAPNLIQTKIDFGANPANRDPLGMGYRHYFLNGGYKFQIPGKDIILEPSVMVKYVQGPYPQVDGGLTVRLLKDQIAFGVFYRNPSFISIQSKFLFDNSIPLLLSFDFSTAPFQNYSIGATEVMLGYDFIKNVDPLPVETPETNENTRF